MDVITESSEICYNTTEVISMIITAENWKDYECLDAGEGEKLERWGPYIIRRPDPVAIWPKNMHKDWQRYDACYYRSPNGGGKWEFKRKLPESWTITYQNLTFKVSLTGFKHTGLFPEQAVNWDWMKNKIQSSQQSQLRILNLFAYTGGATLAVASCNQVVEVVHVDAAKGMVQWAKENVALSQFTNKHIRFIVDDAIKFVEREARRGRTYHGIIMDPPSYGRGPQGEMWKSEENLVQLLVACQKVLDPEALFLVLNNYTTGLSSTVITNLLKTTLQGKNQGQVEANEIGLKISYQPIDLPCGVTGKWFR